MELGENLIDTWLKLRCGEAGGVSQEKALRDLNRRTGRSTGRGRLWEWRSGKHTPPPDVIRAMLMDVLPLITPLDKLGRVRADRVAKALAPPNRPRNSKGSDSPYAVN